MSLKIFEDLVQGTPEWLAARRGIVTASVVGQLVGPRLDRAAGADNRPRQPAHRGGERVMDECEICGRVDRTVKWTTVHIDYNYGPIKHRICRDCAES